MIFRALVDFDPAIYRAYGIKAASNVAAFVLEPIYWDTFQAVMKKHVAKNDARLIAGKDAIRLELTVTVDYRSRSLSQNAWLWAAHTLEANFLNGHRSAWTEKHNILFSERGTITPEDVHYDYMEQYAARGYVDVDPSMLQGLIRMIEADTGHVMKREPLPDGRVRLEVWKTSSYLDVKEFCELARKVEAQMLSYGVTFREAYEFLDLQDQLAEIEKRIPKERINS